MLRNIVFSIIFILSLLLLFWSILLSFLILSDIPPSYTKSDLYDYYKSIAVMFIFFMLTIKIAATSLQKYILILIPISFVFLFQLYSMLHSFLYYMYYNKDIFLMDITLLLSVLLIMLLDMRQYFKYKKASG